MDKFEKAITIDSMTSKSSKLTSTSLANNDGSPFGNGSDLQIRTVKPSEYRAAAACLADAFSVDEVATYFLDCPDTVSWSKERRWALHVKLMEAVVIAHVKCGVAQAIGDPSNGGTFDAVALWMPPGADVDAWTIVRTGLWKQGLQVTWQLSKEGRARFFKEFMPLLHSTKTEVLKERDPSSWYLVYIGTHTRARGKGMAKRLINEVTRKADRESRACYLESSNEVNVPIYRRLGFETARRIHLKRSGGGRTVSLDIMVREPLARKPVLLMTPRSGDVPPAAVVAEAPN